MKFGMINVKYQNDRYFTISSLDREDSSLELTASRKEAQLKGRVNDVSKKNL